MKGTDHSTPSSIAHATAATGKELKEKHACPLLNELGKLLGHFPLPGPRRLQLGKN